MECENPKFKNMLIIMEAPVFNILLCGLKILSQQSKG